MPINSFLYPGAKFTPSYEVANSCRFNEPDDAYMHKTPGGSGSDTTATFSAWVKRSSLSGSAYPRIFEFYKDSNYHLNILFFNTDELRVYSESNGSSFQLKTNRKFRDLSAWLHICITIDTTNGTADNRLRMYINGTEETSFASRTNPTSSADLDFNDTNATHYIGRKFEDSDHFNGYMAEVCFIDGQALTPASFGEFDSDSPTIWKPKDVSTLTFGTNGFYLDFKDSSNLGNDANGGTDFTEVNLTAVSQSTDTCTNNFATLNPLNPIVHDFEEGNLRIDGTTTNWDSAFSTIGASSGKWYFEMKFLALEGGLRRAAMGLVDARGQTQFATNEVGYTVSGASGDSVGYNGNGTSNTIKKNDTAQYNGTEWSVNDIICMAVDLDNSAVYFRVNGSAWLNSGNPESGSSKTGAVTITAGETYVFGGTAYGSSTEWQFNFGSPSYSESGGNSDGNGYGNFNQSVPSGYYALNTKNLAEYG